MTRLLTIGCLALCFAAVSGFGVVVPTTMPTSSTTTQLDMAKKRTVYAKPPIDGAGLAQAVGWFGAAGASAGLILLLGSAELPEVKGPSLSLPSLPSVSLPQGGGVAVKKEKPAKKAAEPSAAQTKSAERYAAKRAAIEAKQQAEQASKKAVASSKKNKAESGPDSYEGLVQKAASSELTKTSETITVEKKAKAEAAKVDTVGNVEDTLKSQLKSVP